MKRLFLICSVLMLLAFPCLAQNKPLEKIIPSDQLTSEIRWNFDILELDRNSLFNGTASLEVSSIEATGGFFTDLYIGTDINTNPWQAYSATETGWSGTPTQTTYYKKTGRTVWVVYQVDGTSDSTSSSITLPFTASNTVDFYFTMGRTYDNGADEAAGTARILKNTATVDFYRSPFPASWTNSGNKIVYGVLIYETD